LPLLKFRVPILLCTNPFGAPHPVSVLIRKVMIAQAMTRVKNMGGILQEVKAETDAEGLFAATFTIDGSRTSAKNWFMTVLRKHRRELVVELRLGE
jgi:hypothetical protein